MYLKMDKNNILLHVCCAPCMIYPLERLRDQNFEISGFFYNPNIEPLDEFQKRKMNVFDYSNRTDCAMLFNQDEESNEFFVAFKGKLDAPVRCHTCWYLRLKKTAEHARKIKVKYFTTTLLVSPYQDRLKIKEIGEKVALETGVRFHYEDFSSEYQYAVKVSKYENMYRQKYCGCSLSIKEAKAARKKKSQKLNNAYKRI